MPKGSSDFPRPLEPRERAWMEWILPSDRPGYARYRGLLPALAVIGEGSRGSGEIMLGRPGVPYDPDAPLPGVFAYGAIEADAGLLSITIREMRDERIPVEIVSSRAEEVPAAFTEYRRWTYSTWDPGMACPQCLAVVREVPMHTPAGGRLSLALCARDRRLWVYDAAQQVNHLVPVTNYYNELMLHKNIREPGIALDSRRLFTDLAGYSDEDLAYAFMTYNKLRTKVRVEGTLEPDMSAPAPASVLRRFFTRLRNEARR